VNCGKALRRTKCHSSDTPKQLQADFLVKGAGQGTQVLATALAAYATDAALDGTGVAANYGFVGDGAGAAAWGVGSAGGAFGVANGTSLTVPGLRPATDGRAVGGLLDDGNAARRNEANAVNRVPNQAGGIS